MDSIVLITGGSRGIGRATSIELAKHGYFVCINFKSNPESAISLEQQILNTVSKALTVKADVSGGK